MDDGEEEEYDEEIEAENPEQENPDADVERENQNGSRGHNNENKKKKKKGHRSSKSHNHTTEAMKKELQDLKEMVQRIPGVPKPLEKATPTSYADSPFVDNIALVETPKRFNVPPMKAYDGSTDPLEHVAQYK